MMTATNNCLAIYGCGGHARSIANTALKNAIAQLLFVDSNAKWEEQILSFPVIKELLPGHLPTLLGNIIGLGDNYLRQQRFQNLLANDLLLTNLIAKSASIGHESAWGRGNFIGEHAYLGPEVQVGDNNILNTRCIIEHECRIGSHNHIAINAVIAGRCQVGDFVMIGANATVIDGIRIGSHVTIGAGAVVTQNIDESGLYVGVPAKKIK